VSPQTARRLKFLLAHLALIGLSEVHALCMLAEVLFYVKQLVAVRAVERRFRVVNCVSLKISQAVEDFPALFTRNFLLLAVRVVDVVRQAIVGIISLAALRAFVLALSVVNVPNVRLHRLLQCIALVAENTLIRSQSRVLVGFVGFEAHCRGQHGRTQIALVFLSQLERQMMDQNVRANFVLAIALERAEIALVFGQFQVLGFDVKVQVVVSLENFPAVWTNSEISLVLSLDVARLDVLEQFAFVARPELTVLALPGVVVHS
jgi:hypothetical protein